MDYAYWITGPGLDEITLLWREAQAGGEELVERSRGVVETDGCLSTGFIKGQAYVNILVWFCYVRLWF